MRERVRSPGVSTSLSVLVTVMLLVSGLLIVTMVSQIVLAGRLLELRRAGEVAVASSEALQAYVYRDVNTNRTLLTLRNSGKEALEITDIMVVDGGGSVVKLLKLDETIKLGPQQSLTRYLSEILGLEYDRYDDVRSRIASLYFKTFRGRVFGSMYLAPSSIEVAAYSTSATTITSQVTSTESLQIPTITEVLLTTSATVIIDNPSHWPVEGYVGVAFPRNRVMDGFPEWGFHPGLKAIDQRGNVRNVTLSDIKLPRLVACYERRTTYDATWYSKWSGNIPVHRYSDYFGPTYMAVKYYADGGYLVCDTRINDYELFFPYGTAVNIWPNWTVRHTIDLDCTTYVRWTGSGYSGSCGNSYPTDKRLLIEKIEMTLYVPQQVWGRIGVSTPWGYFSCSAYNRDGPTSCSREVTINSFTDPYTFAMDIVTSSAGNPSSSYGIVKIYTADVGTEQLLINYPKTIYFKSESSRGYVADYYRLAYIKVVDLWNTSNVLGFFDASNSPSTPYEALIRMRIDRPVGVAAVYVYSHTVEELLPPAVGSPYITICRVRVDICESDDVRGRIQYIDGAIFPCNQTSTQVTFRTTDPQRCDAFVVPRPDTYRLDEVKGGVCPKSGDTITCTASMGQVIILDCEHQPPPPN